MNNLQHTTIMAIEEMTANSNEYHPSDKIASKVKNYITADLEQIQEALNLLCKEGYLSVTKTNYQLTEKGYFYANTYELIDERVNHHVNSKYSSQISCLWIALGIIALTVFVFGLIIFR